MRYSLIGLLMLLGSSAWADCACFCAESELRTMCTSVDEAQADTSSCAGANAAACPEASDQVNGATYDSPVVGAINCRDVRVWNSKRGVYVEIPACDVEDES